MNNITVVDARMGRGKSSAAVRYMNEHKGEKRFLYITPYLSEVERVCEQCMFVQPDDERFSKSCELKIYLLTGKSVSATHSLFCLMDNEALELIRDMHYTLIIDESIQAIEKVNITSNDLELILPMTTEEENGRLGWKDKRYTGAFNRYKTLIESGSVYYMNTALINVLNPDILRAFDEVFMLTYLFEGQYQKAYLDFFGFNYRVIGIEADDEGYKFADKPDSPPPTDYGSLIHIEDRPKLNFAGSGEYALSKTWYDKRDYDDPEVKRLRLGMSYFFQRSCTGGSSTRLWTCYKEDAKKLINKNGRFRNNFLHLNAKATNEYRNCTDLAYMINRFADPNLTKFFAARGVRVDPDAFALSEMLQWIWRGAIREGKPINLYIPSERMRNLLIKWIGENS